MAAEASTAHGATAASSRRIAIIVAAVAMVVVSLLAGWLKPRPASRSAAMFSLEEVFPKQLQGWRLEPASGNAIINPQLQASVDKLYSQVLARTYVNAEGYRIMLSVAYGNDQRGALQAHMPDLCYPAQGFKVLSKSQSEVALGATRLPVHRLTTELGARKEPLSYWFVYGQRLLPTSATWQRRWIDVRVGLDGQIADGLLVRVSSIDARIDQAYAQQAGFIQALVQAMPEARRPLVIGKPER
jgi:EpsI family protein